MKQYALIGYEITEVANVQFNEETVTYSDRYCSCCETPKENFILGDKAELEKRLYKELNKDQEDKNALYAEVEKALEKQNYKTSRTEEMIIGTILDDDQNIIESALRNNTLIETIQDITKGSLNYMEFHSSLFEAYMDYVH